MPLSVEYVLQCLDDGMLRKDISTRLGYKNSSSLDQFMRRRHYVWDSIISKYVMTPKHPDYVALLPNEDDSDLVRQIVLRFNRRDADAKNIATNLGFGDHKEMADYMRSRGYTWSTVQRNYVSQNCGPTVDTQSASVSLPDLLQQWNLYLPLLQLLEQNRNSLFNLPRNLPQTHHDTNVIPRYVVPGPVTVKSVHMPVRLCSLIRDFSDQTKISQKELVQIALIDFFKKYGFQKEVEYLLPHQ